MVRPSEPHTRWDFEWRDDGRRFHVLDFYVDEDFRGRGHGGRLLLKIIKYVCRETDATSFSVQMGGGAESARWLQEIGETELEHFFQVRDVQGYSGDDWRKQNAERVDGEEDKEGDAQSSVYAELEELDGLRQLKGWK